MVAEQLQVHVRWMIERDFAEVLAIENMAFEYPWDDRELRISLRQHNVIGMVATVEDEVVGYVIYLLHPHCLQLMNLAVRVDSRRRGVGRQLVACLQRKLSPGGRSKITLAVRETNLKAQLFFRALGFRSTSVLRGWYDETSEDAYVMEYSQ